MTNKIVRFALASVIGMAVLVLNGCTMPTINKYESMEVTVQFIDKTNRPDLFANAPEFVPLEVRRWKHMPVYTGYNNQLRSRFGRRGDYVCRRAHWPDGRIIGDMCVLRYPHGVQSLRCELAPPAGYYADRRGWYIGSIPLYLCEPSRQVISHKKKKEILYVIPLN